MFYFKNVHLLYLKETKMFKNIIVQTHRLCPQRWVNIIYQFTLSNVI